MTNQIDPMTETIEKGKRSLDRTLLNALMRFYFNCIFGHSKVHPERPSDLFNSTKSTLFIKTQSQDIHNTNPCCLSTTIRIKN